MKESRERQKRELYCKEKSLLQLPLFYFEMCSKQKVEISWQKEDGRECKIVCHSGRGLPGSLEQDVYAACMRLWVLQGMSDDGIEVDYSSTALTLNLNPVYWKTPIKKALLKLGAARYEFTECFIDAKKRKIERTVQFSLFDTTAFEEAMEHGRKIHKCKIYFPKEIKINLDQKYYQWLDFQLYTSIKSGVPRRLYEFLEKRRYHQIEGTFSIGEEKLFRWIPLTNKNISMRRKTLRDAVEALIEVQYLADYQWDRKSKVFFFTYGTKLPRMAVGKNARPKGPVKLAPLPDIEEILKEFPSEVPAEIPPELAGIFSSEVAKKTIQQREQKNNTLQEEQLQTLFGLLKVNTNHLKQAVIKYYQEFGFDYVRWNIRYANENAKKKYASYLQQSLEKNWALAMQEEVEQNELQAQKKEQEELAKAQEQARQQQEIELKKRKFFDLVKENHDKIAANVHERWEKAKAVTTTNGRRSEFPMKLEFTKLIAEEFGITTIGIDIHFLADIANIFLQDRSPETE